MSMATYSEKLKDPRWQKRRLEVFEKDNFSCMFCGENKETLHVHHFRYTGDPWEAEIGDLCTLCESCHEIEHLKSKMGILERELYGIIVVQAMNKVAGNDGEVSKLLKLAKGKVFNFFNRG